MEFASGFISMMRSNLNNGMCLSSQACDFGEKLFILDHFFSSTGVHEFISFFNLESVERRGGGGDSSTFGQNGVRFLLVWGVTKALSWGGGVGGGQNGVRFLFGGGIGKV